MDELLADGFDLNALDAGETLGTVHGSQGMIGALIWLIEALVHFVEQALAFRGIQEPLGPIGQAGLGRFGSGRPFPIDQ